MIDFGLKPCPLCGGEAEVASLAQGHDYQKAVIKCAICGLTLALETDIRVGISRSGKHTVEKEGLDPIEAWNRRTACDPCPLPDYLKKINSMPGCNDCGCFRDCQYRPQPGEMVRINCPLWQPREGEA